MLELSNKWELLLNCESKSKWGGEKVKTRFQFFFMHIHEEIRQGIDIMQ